MKIYTKAGDRGETSLLGGKRVKKNCIEIDAIGEVDELNAYIGVLIASLTGSQFQDVCSQLMEIQHCLFMVGSNIADVQMQIGNVPKIFEADVQMLEDWIDKMEQYLTPLTQFILPGGNISAAHSFFARAVCRRAERRVVELCEQFTVLDPMILQYLNRLSDVLFVLGRWINMKQKIAETYWQKRA